MEGPPRERGRFFSVEAEAEAGMGAAAEEVLEEEEGGWAEEDAAVEARMVASSELRRLLTKGMGKRKGQDGKQMEQR